MKIGLRTPSPSRSFKARTIGRLNRQAKRAFNPTYGRKGVGYIKNPERAMKNSIYHKTTASVFDSNSSCSKSKKQYYSNGNASSAYSSNVKNDVTPDIKMRRSSVDDPPPVWLTILCLILLYPVGIFLMWRYMKWDKVIKIILSVVVGLIYFGVLLSD